MNVNAKYTDAPSSVREFLVYKTVNSGMSGNTVDQYYLDIRTFLRYLTASRDNLNGVDEKDIDVSKCGHAFLESVTKYEIMEYLNYVITQKKNSHRTAARKLTSVRELYKYHCLKMNTVKNNPTEGIDTPKFKPSLPKFLDLDESVRLLSVIDSRNSQRDYAMIVLFLNCGMRLSELVGINMNSLFFSESENRYERLLILGKGNKERMVYLNGICDDALKKYIKIRETIPNLIDRDALFVSSQRKRIDKRQVQYIVENNLKKAGLSARNLSTHKLRHTAATLMYQHGNVDVLALKEILGHEQLNTTQIYTHVSDKKLSEAVNANPLNHLKDQKNK